MLNIQDKRKYLDRFIDTQNISDAVVEQIYQEQQKFDQKKFEKQLKKSLREGKQKYKKLMERPPRG